jgi:transketolase
MGAICNGIAYDGIFRAVRRHLPRLRRLLPPSIRLAALSKLPVTYIFTHDSVGVGEDGPTHQPVETVSGLRVIPNLDVIRPGDAEETAGAFAAAMERTDGPTALILTRQAVPMMNDMPVETRREGTLGRLHRQKGNRRAHHHPHRHRLRAAARHGRRRGKPGVRVVSMPCFERFDRQSAEYRESVLPAACTKRIAIEAGVSGLWWKYVGTRRQGPRHRPLRHQRPRQHRDEGTVCGQWRVNG